MLAIPTALEGRIEANALPLAIGDLLAIIAVLTYGMVDHNTFGDPGYMAMVYAPFVIGWLVAFPLIGAYSAGAAESAKAAIPLGIRAWVLAALVGFALRWTSLFPGGLAPVFVAITLVLIGALIGVWRWGFFKITG
ncbi:DUF3054 domain-containing protein [Natronocalculus amylovorans]|uniref:DUF3054 domain-containing protein n=1 Tax=Natronocalculus amylovorans TaxID=2917812 RepID=A0AAE3FW50_9EURY|nr:DUF3054 domain-containing protein [Natronocalculus amylovorans]MCL9816291.1 DUF3054 domain-containing protein [Natronocalculus amylovorans]